ncbi:MAG: DUF1343 domain-containing protein [Chitinophagales bacterium]|nr:DUF1343 domain-containing protein [Chitinophagales bacterium]
MNGLKFLLCFSLGFLLTACINAEQKPLEQQEQPQTKPIVVGAERFDQYLEKLKGKNVGMVVNQTSLVGAPYKETHLVDSLLKLKISVKKILTPEHGFRGTADAGEKVKSGIDEKTGLPLVSLYGNNKKPTSENLNDLDVLVFDIQDVGARFYTYISTLHFVMEACAENDKELIVLDRPNPNGFYIDGPVLDTAYRSFVGMHPVPVVHGMTIGEYAKMLNGEKWLKNGAQCKLTVIACENYDHSMLYKVRVKPSPNLPNMTAMYLYPSLCFFEGTPVSVGRGTDKPFQIIGHPDFAAGTFTFTPKSMEGAKEPPLKDVQCKGIDLSTLQRDYFLKRKSLNLEWLIEFYQKFPNKEKFFTPFFTKLTGTTELQKQIEQGKSEDEIRASWMLELEQFKNVRMKYLLYADFE